MARRRRHPPARYENTARSFLGPLRRAATMHALAQSLQELFLLCHKYEEVGFG